MQVLVAYFLGHMRRAGVGSGVAVRILPLPLAYVYFEVNEY